MNRKILWAFVFIILFGLSAFFLFQIFEDTRKPLLKAKVALRDIRQVVRGFGYLEAEQIYPVQASFAGELKSIFVKAGDQVKPRALFFEIRNKDFEEDYRLRRAQYRKNQSQLKKMMAGPDPDALSEAQAYLNKTRQLSQELSKENLDKQELFEKGFVSKKEVEGIKARRENAYLEEKIALERYKKALTPPPQEEIELKRAEASKMKTELDHFREQWRRRKARANFPAVIVEILKKVRDKVNEDEPILTWVNREEPLLIQAMIHESQIGKIAKGHKAVVTLNGVEGKYLAEVAEISLSAKSTGGARKFPVKLSLSENIQDPLRLGVGADYEILLAERKNIPTLPLQFIVHQGSQTGVWCERAWKLDFVPLELGLQDEMLVEVLEGLSVGQEVVLQTENKEVAI